MTRERPMRERSPGKSHKRWPWMLAGAAVASTLVGTGLTYSASAGHVELPSLSEKLHAPALRLQHVDFVGLEKLSADALWSLANVSPGTALIDVDGDAVAARVAAHPRIEWCRALRVPPNRLLIGVRERHPVAVEADSGSGVDERGTRFPLLAGEAERLPRIDGDLDAALPLLRAARERGVGIRSIRSRAGDLRFRPHSREVDVRVGGSPGSALADWVRLDASGLIDEYGPREIDLRFSGSAVLRDLRTNRGGEDGTS